MITETYAIPDCELNLVFLEEKSITSVIVLLLITFVIVGEGNVKKKNCNR